MNSCKNLRARCKPVDFSKTCNVSWCASPSDSLYMYVSTLLCKKSFQSLTHSKCTITRAGCIEIRAVLMSRTPGPSIEFAVFWLIRGGAGSGCLANCARASCSRGAALAHVFSYGHAGDAFCSRAVLNAR